MRNGNSLLDKYLAAQQQIEMLGHRSGQRVLDRDHGPVHRSALNPIKHLGRTRARHHRAARHHAQGRLVTESSRFALDRNFHGEQRLQRKTLSVLRFR